MLRSIDKKPARQLEAVHLLVETVSLPHNDAAQLVREHLAAGGHDAAALRAKLRKKIDAGAAEVIDSSYARHEAGKLRLGTAAAERMVPTQWQSSSRDGVRGRTGLSAHLLPTEIETHSLGLQVQCETRLVSGAAEDGLGIEIDWSIDAREMLERVKFGTGIAEIEVPVFFEQRCSTRGAPGHWQLLGSFSPAETDASTRTRTRTLVLAQVQNGATDAVLDAPAGEQPQPFLALLEAIEVDADATAALLDQHAPMPMAPRLGRRLWSCWTMAPPAASRPRSPADWQAIRNYRPRSCNRYGN